MLFKKELISFSVKDLSNNKQTKLIRLLYFFVFVYSLCRDIFLLFRRFIKYREFKKPLKYGKFLIEQLAFINEALVFLVHSVLYLEIAWKGGGHWPPMPLPWIRPCPQPLLVCNCDLQ